MSYIVNRGWVRIVVLLLLAYPAEVIIITVIILNLSRKVSQACHQLLQQLWKVYFDPLRRFSNSILVFFEVNRAGFDSAN
ncbi:unnamed protein product [Trifolium pratense]|uniref:Uncharacterized protein n=1 Tax=Trifolium pratense TaxID=57577 RepID=A0ACB0K735_TRIPR|nr:unnamed protein product [Trifolium pratense]